MTNDFMDAKRKKEGKHSFKEAMDIFGSELYETQEFIVVTRLKDGGVSIHSTTADVIEAMGMLEYAKNMCMYEED